MRFSSGRQSQVACISELHPAKTGPCLNSNSVFFSWFWMHARVFPEEKRKFYQPSCLSVFICFRAYLFSVVNSPYAKHIDCDKASENAHLYSLRPCACAWFESSAGCLEVVDITLSSGQAAKSALCIKWGLPKDRFRSHCQEFRSTINLNVAIRIW